MADTRAVWYQLRFGGGYRTARKPRRCEQLGCFATIAAGERYFDTCSATTWPKTKCICATCAESTI